MKLTKLTAHKLDRAIAGLSPRAGTVYHLINPEVPYTLRAPSFQLAAAAVFALGAARCSVRSLDGKLESATFSTWRPFAQHWGMTDTSGYIRDNRAEISQVLDSVLIGEPSDRVLVERLIKSVPSDRRLAWLAVRQQQCWPFPNGIKRKAEFVAESLLSAHLEGEAAA